MSELGKMDNAALAGFWDDVRSAFRSNDAPKYLSKPRLSRGDEKAAVSELQALLNINQTGKFNASTENAVKTFQASRGLPTSGVVDGPEWAALLGEVYVPGARGTQVANTVTDVAAAGTNILQSLLPPTAAQQEAAMLPPPQQQVQAGSWWPWLIGGGAVIATSAAAYYFLVHKKNAALANPWEEDEMDWDFGEDDETDELEEESEETIVANPLALRGNT